MLDITGGGRPNDGQAYSTFKAGEAQWYVGPSKRSRWDAYRLQVAILKKHRNRFVFLGWNSKQWARHNPRRGRGLAGSAPGRMEGRPFRPRRSSEPTRRGGPRDMPNGDDDHSQDDSDNDDDDDDRNSYGRQWMAQKVALILRDSLGWPGHRSPAPECSDRGQPYNLATQVRSTQHVPRADSPTQMSMASSASEGDDDELVYNGPATRLRRALSAPLQGVLAIRYHEDESDEDTPEKGSPPKARVQTPVESKLVTAPSRYSPETEPFPEYVDPMQEASQELPTPRSYTPASSSSSSFKQPVGLEAVLLRLPDGFVCSSGTTPANDGPREVTQSRVPVNSLILPTPFSRHSLTAYQGNLSLRRTGTDSPSPSTTYSSPHLAKSLSGQTAASSQNVSPWVQQLYSDDISASPGETIQEPHRRRFAKLLQTVFRGREGDARPNGIKRFWQKVKPQRRGKSSPASPSPPLPPRGQEKKATPAVQEAESRSAKPAKPAGPPKNAPRTTTTKPFHAPKTPFEPTIHRTPGGFTPAPRTEAWGLGRRRRNRKRKAKKTPRGTSNGTGHGRGHRTASETTATTTYDTEDDEYDYEQGGGGLMTRERHQPLVGAAANSVYMAASATGAGGGGGGGF